MNATDAGTLYVVSTPIGNLEDITLRALRILKEVDFIVAEDTRHSGRLLKHFEINTPFASSNYQGVEKERVEKFLGMLRAGKSLALISDAGTPLLSDPGYPLVHAANEANIDIIPIPGATAMMAALVKSGFPTDHFIFAGTPSKKDKARSEYFLSIVEEKRTVALYESSHRIMKTLGTIQEILPDRTLALCRELTKLHEEILQGTASELFNVLNERDAVKGEFVLLIHGTSAIPHQDWSNASLEEHVHQFIEQGETPTQAIKTVAKLRNLPKRQVYDTFERAKAK